MNKKVKEIQYGGFSYSGLTSLVIPATVEIIDSIAFKGCNLETVIFERKQEFTCATDSIRLENNLPIIYIPEEYPLDEICGITDFIKYKSKGESGETVNWILDSDNQLLFSGTGKIKDYEEGEQPWLSYANDIKSIQINRHDI